MTLHETSVEGAFELKIEPVADERGFFARTWCRTTFSELGLNPNIAQCSVSFNPHRFTLRGMHFQKQPYQEAKLVRCTQGAIFDVVVDLRAGSPTFRRWAGIRLTAEERNMLYVPEGCAHGFLTLEPDTEVFYQISEFYHPESAGGVRWNDPAFRIEWPAEPLVISGRDRGYADFAGDRP